MYVIVLLKMPKAYEKLERFRIHLVISLYYLIFIIIMSIITSNNPQTILAQNNETNTDNSYEGHFVNSFQTIVIKSHLLNHNYQVQVAKWERRGYDNQTMISITDNYLPKYQNLIKETMSLTFQAPSKYGKAIELYLKSLESEFQSYIHFKNYLLTGNLMENETSVQLLSDALRYEAESFAAFKSVSTSTNDGIYRSDTLLIRLTNQPHAYAYSEPNKIKT